MKTIFIVNPAAASGALKIAWDSLARGLKSKIQKFDFVFTEGAGDASKLTRKALKKGFEFVVAVGGDGTLSECVNGFFEEGVSLNPKAMLGILPFGRGSDFARHLGFSRLPEKAMLHLKGSNFKKVDVGYVALKSFSGQTSERYFINVANIGLVPHVVNWAHKAPKIIGAMGAYVYGALMGAVEYKSQDVEYIVNNQKKNQNRLLNMVIANGPYFGAGMKIAPGAKVDDGLFDVLVAGHMSLLKFARHFPALYSGKHIKLPNVSFVRADCIEINPQKGAKPLLVELDGDTVGTLPATFKILHRALRFKV